MGATLRVWMLSVLFAGIMCTLACFSDCAALAEEEPAVVAGAPAEPEPAEYHTPLAGEPFSTEFFGRQVRVPQRDRGRLTAITLGGAYGTPKVGSMDALPIFAIYLKRVGDDYRTRNMIGFFVNDLEYDKGLWGPVELVARFENDTIPVGRTEVLNNRELKTSSLYWGTVLGSLGPGLRFPVRPFEIDNDLRLQLLGTVGYFYAEKDSDTGPAVIPPRDTVLYGGKFRGRYDGMRRNLLELPHRGMAAGFDLDYIHRDRWADFQTLGATRFKRDDTRNYLHFGGYAMAAAGVPGLSEKNRLLFSFHGATAKMKSTDRFNAFRISGGPFPTETDDLYRPDYEGTMFHDLLVANYLLASVEYRRELAFFIYLGVRCSYINADLATLVADDLVAFRERDGVAMSANLDTGFFWDSQLHMAYSWDSGFVRYGKDGSGIILTWSKAW